MKKLLLMFKSITLITVFIASVIAVSCEKENDLILKKSISEQEAELKKNGRSLRPGTESIATIAINAGFSELVAALIYVDEELDAGLVDLFLNGKDQYTVFAPTNEAFEALFDFLEIDEISDLDPELVLNVLLYHVTEGRRAANSVVPPVQPRKIKTLLGETFSVDKYGKITAIGNTAEIVVPNISASNGIIHVIDSVILPIVVE